ncbi:Ig-like domain-containing protein [Robiginitalea sediminis]|uniref:Ig-like domain-containing protein n=1 Tax=Robiginitalea sediminis TaxID=1982593 RepID=UPI0013037353|nr:Ig-like domain-containing protein [Robiginitalea sediminis]
MKVKITLLLALTLLFSLQGRAQCNGATFEEENGIVVIQAESGNLSGSWQRQSSASGFTGSGYIVWNGSDYFNNPGNGVINYTVRINSPGTYRFTWRSRVGIGDVSTEHNDTWLRIPDAADFFAQNGSSILYPKGSGKTPNPNGAGAGGWFKVFLSGTTSWTWSTRTSDFNGHNIYARFNSAGNYTIQLSARSRGHQIDKIVMYKESQWSDNAARSNNLAETRCGGTNNPPPDGGGGGDTGGGDTGGGGTGGGDTGGGGTGGGDTGGGGSGGNDGPNTPPSVSITSPADGQNVAAGSNVRIDLNASDSDGTIAQHRIFVNGTRVDLDGSTYTPHVIENITAGAYTIRAVVVDNNGATAEATVNITAGGSGGGDTGGGDTGGGDTGGGDTGGGDTGGGDTGGGDTGGGNDGSNTPPSVSITSPSDGQNVAVGSNVRVELDAADSDGSIAQHRIFVNGSRVDLDGPNYTPHVIENIAAGTYAIRALVTDNNGATAEATVTITVGGSGGDTGGGDTGGGDTGGGDTGGGDTGGGSGDPVVAITNPADGENFNAGNDVRIELAASDSDGSVVRHQIFVNGALVDTDGSGYTPHVIRNIENGAYTIRAVVTDNNGNQGESTVNITVGGSAGSGGGSGDGGGDGTPPPANNVTLNLINANTDQVVRSVEPGINIQFGEARNFQATTTVAGVASVRIQLSGALNSNRIESVAPYSAFGDVNGDYAPTNLPDGNYTLTATFYSGGNASGTQLASRSVSFSVGSGSNSGKTVVDLAKVVVYPNPVPDGQVTVKLPVPLQSTYAYQLMAPNGQIVDYGVKENASASDTSSLYLKGLEQSQEGIYYLTLTDGVHTFSVPVVKK